MAEIIFTYEGRNINIQCGINDKMRDIISKYISKIQNKEENIDYFVLTYLYKGRLVNPKSKKTFYRTANDIDKNRKQMNILVNKDNKTDIQYEKTSESTTTITQGPVNNELSFL